MEHFKKDMKVIRVMSCTSRYCSRVINPMPINWWNISSNINYKLISRVIRYFVGNGHFGDVEIRIFMD